MVYSRLLRICIYACVSSILHVVWDPSILWVTAQMVNVWDPNDLWVTAQKVNVWNPNVLRIPSQSAKMGALLIALCTVL